MFTFKASCSCWPKSVQSYTTKQVSPHISTFVHLSTEKYRDSVTETHRYEYWTTIRIQNLVFSAFFNSLHVVVLNT